MDANKDMTSADRIAIAEHAAEVRDAALRLHLDPPRAPGGGTGEGPPPGYPFSWA